jgi:hypothetical protein
MPEFIVEFLLTEVRIARVEAASEEIAKSEIKHYHNQHDSEMTDELVIILKVDEDK